MSKHIKYATSHLHELAAKIEEMVFSGYRVDHRSAFAARRLGSAYQIYFLPTREALDFEDDNYSEQEEKILTEAYSKIAEGRVSKTSATERAILDAAFANLDKEENCNHIDKQAVEELNQLTIQQKWEIDDELAVINMTEEQSKAISDRGKEARLKRLHEKYDQSEGDAYYFLTLLEKDTEQEEIEPIPKGLLDRSKGLRDEGAEEVIGIIKKANDKLIESRVEQAETNREREEALNELAAQSQELDMYHVDNGIFDRLVESIKSAQNNPEGCVSTIVEVDKERVKMYSKSELENMEWSEFKKLIDDAGIRGRRRQNLTRDYLIYQEEIMK